MPTAIGTSPVEVRQCPLQSGLRRLRSGNAHCNPAVAVEIRRCPLRSRAGKEGEDADKKEQKKKEEEEEDEEEQEKQHLIKSNHPHLAGGEISIFTTVSAKSKLTALGQKKTGEQPTAAHD